MSRTWDNVTKETIGAGILTALKELAPRSALVLKPRPPGAAGQIVYHIKTRSDSEPLGVLQFENTDLGVNVRGQHRRGERSALTVPRPVDRITAEWAAEIVRDFWHCVERSL